MASVTVHAVDGRLCWGLYLLAVELVVFVNGVSVLHVCGPGLDVRAVQEEACSRTECMHIVGGEGGRERTLLLINAPNLLAQQVTSNTSEYQSCRHLGFVTWRPSPPQTVTLFWRQFTTNTLKTRKAFGGLVTNGVQIGGKDKTGPVQRHILTGWNDQNRLEKFRHVANYVLNDWITSKVTSGPGWPGWRAQGRKRTQRRNKATTSASDVLPVPASRLVHVNDGKLVDSFARILHNIIPWRRRRVLSKWVDQIIVLNDGDNLVLSEFNR